MAHFFCDHASFARKEYGVGAPYSRAPRLVYLPLRCSITYTFRGQINTNSRGNSSGPWGPTASLSERKWGTYGTDAPTGRRIAECAVPVRQRHKGVIEVRLHAARSGPLWRSLCRSPDPKQCAAI